MSHDEYTEHNNAISAGTQPTAEEYRFMNMTPDQRREHVHQTERAMAKAAHDAKEADIQRRAAEATQIALKGNQWLHAQERGLLNQRVTVQGGKMTVERLNAPIDMNAGPFTAPQALVDQLPVTIGGIQLGPQQAKEMMLRGEISERDYYAATDAALVPYGYGKQTRSFR